MKHYYIIIEVSWDYYKFIENLAVVTDKQEAIKLAKKLAKERGCSYVEEEEHESYENEEDTSGDTYVTIQTIM